MSPVLRLERLDRAFTQGNRRIDVLKGASASFVPGEAVKKVMKILNLTKPA